MDDTSFNIRIPKRWVRVAMIVGVTALVVAPLTAIASHSFTDVPNSNTFHSDIEWMKASGVTKGCNPPENTEYCPDDSVTRGQMAAFMNRFAGYIGATDGTPAQADHATNADHATSADNANQLGGANPAAYRSHVGGSLIEATFGEGPTAIETITDFTAPTSGGVLVVTADATFIEDSGPQFGAVWLEVNGTGGCDGTPSVFALFETATSGFGVANASVSTTDLVGPGDHRIDVCTAGIGTNTTATQGSLTVQWVEESEGATIAAADVGRSVHDILSDLSGQADALLDH